MLPPLARKEDTVNVVLPGQSECFRRLFERSHDAILICRAEDERILEVNDRGCAMYGFSRDEFIGITLARAFGISLQEMQWTPQSAPANDGGAFESVHRRKDGSSLIVEIIASLIEYQGGAAVLVVIRDVSAIKEAAARLATAVRRDALATIVVGGVAHEFNSVLLAAGTYLHWASSDPAGYEASISKAAGLIQRAQSLSASLLELFAGPVLTDPPTLSLASWLPAIVGRLASSLPSGISIELGPIPEAIEARADAASLTQALRILLINAADSLDGQGTINVSASSIDARDSDEWGVEIRVGDHGPGVPASGHGRVFEPFFATRTRSGLGLAIALRLIELTGGVLLFEPNKPYGSVFVIRLRAGRR